MGRKKFLWAGIAGWAFLTFFIGWVLITPDNPLTKLYRAPVKQLNERILTGPYPTAANFDELKAQGVTTDISLLDPKIPYERILLNREEANAKRVGIRFLDFPVASIMGQRFGSYYDAHVQGAAHTIDSLEHDAQGDKTYLHCYLGEHRMVAVRTALGIKDTTASGTVQASLTKVK